MEEGPYGHHLEDPEEAHHFASGVDIHPLPWDLHHLEEALHFLRPYPEEVELALPLAQLVLCLPTDSHSCESLQQ